jgi:DNA-binding XRE family transcriptional regulator
MFCKLIGGLLRPKYQVDRVRQGMTNHVGSHALQNLEKCELPALLSQHYTLSRNLPRELFIRDYPVNPGNFGERLRKARMDAGMQTKELAGLLGVTPDTVINWEIRGLRPMRKKVQEKLNHFIAR